MSETMLVIYLSLLAVFAVVAWAFVRSSVIARRRRLFAYSFIVLAVFLFLGDLYTRVAAEILPREVSYGVAHGSLAHAMEAAAKSAFSIDTTDLSAFAGPETRESRDYLQQYGYSPRLIKSDSLVVLLLNSGRPHSSLRPDAVVRLYDIASQTHFVLIAESRNPNNVPLISETLGGKSR